MVLTLTLCLVKLVPHENPATTRTGDEVPMTDLRPRSDSPASGSDDRAAEPGAAPTTGAPRWVRAFGIIAVVLVVVIAVLLLVGGGNHGPGRHTGSAGAAGQALPASGMDAPDLPGRVQRADVLAP